MNDIIAEYRTGCDGLKDRSRSRKLRKTSKKVNHIIKQKSLRMSTKLLSKLHTMSYRMKILPIYVNRNAVIRRLHVGLFGGMNIKKSLISKKNKKAWLQVAKDWPKDWTVEDRKSVAFTDRFKFNLFWSDGRQHVRRPIGRKKWRWISKFLL